MTKNFQAQKDKPQDPGFSLPVAIITGFIILIGSLALTSRSSWGVFGSIFLNQSDEARDAAETGMSRFIAELNLERNRWLLVLRNSRAANENDPDTGIWQNRSTSAKIVELRQNPCLIGTTTSPSIEKPRYSVLDPNDAASTQYKKWFILSDGTITAGSNGVTPANAVKSYRLAGITRQTYATDNKELQKLMSVWRDRTQNPSGVGKVTIQVEGQSYRSGTIIASVILEKELELTPKCCKMPFGEAHGNTDYYDETTRTSVCLNLGLGLLGGAAGTNTGSIIVKGRSTDLEDENGSPVNTIYCLTSNTAGCAIDVKDPDINVSIIDPKLPAAFTFCDKAPSSSCPSGTAPSPGTFTAKDITSTSATDFASVVKKTSGPSGNGLERDTVIINPNATTNIPSYCSASADTMHCNIAVFN